MTDKQKVYILTEGDCDYSSYHIIGVFSTKEEAERLKTIEDNIEEWTLDEYSEHELAYEWITYINLETGNISGNFLPSFHEEIIKKGQRGKTAIFIREPLGKSKKEQHIGEAISYISKEHSIKLAVELRQKYLLNKNYLGEVY